jgi:hypothetical protein
LPNPLSEKASVSPHSVYRFVKSTLLSCQVLVTKSPIPHRQIALIWLFENAPVEDLNLSFHTLLELHFIFATWFHLSPLYYFSLQQIQVKQDRALWQHWSEHLRHLNEMVFF